MLTLWSFYLIKNIFSLSSSVTREILKYVSEEFTWKFFFTSSSLPNEELVKKSPP